MNVEPIKQAWIENNCATDNMFQLMTEELLPNSCFLDKNLSSLKGKVSEVNNLP